MTKESKAKGKKGTSNKKKATNLKQTNLKDTKEIRKINYREREDKKKTIAKARRELHFDKSEGSDEITKLIKIVLIVVAIMLIFYGVTTIVTRKANAVKTVRSISSDEKAEIQYDSLIIGSMLNIDGNYYVLIKKSDDDKLSEYETLIQVIKANEEAPKIYIANLDDSFNNQYLGEDGNYDSDLSKFKVKGTTLVKISDHNIDETYDNYDDIKAKLEELE